MSDKRVSASGTRFRRDHRWSRRNRSLPLSLVGHLLVDSSLFAPQTFRLRAPQLQQPRLLVPRYPLQFLPLFVLARPRPLLTHLAFLLTKRVARRARLDPPGVQRDTPNLKMMLVQFQGPGDASLDVGG